MARFEDVDASRLEEDDSLTPPEGSGRRASVETFELVRDERL
jgi:hypothetical protein